MNPQSVSIRSNKYENMQFLKTIPFLFIFLVIFPSSDLAYAAGEDPKTFKVLANSNKKLSITNVNNLITEGDNLIKKGDFDKAKESFDKARTLAKQLAGFYKDLNGSFRGLDARIPDEMVKKGKQSLAIWAESNARLAAVYKRKKQPEVAVPLLVEIIRIMSPTSSEGKKAYKELIQIGFVETPYRGQ